MKGWMYILKCADGSYYTGSTKDLELRLAQHQSGQGAKHTKKRLPVTLAYVEEFERIDEAFAREKQIQGWRREKKEALILGEFGRLPDLASTASTSSATEAPHPRSHRSHRSLSLSKAERAERAERTERAEKERAEND